MSKQARFLEAPLLGLCALVLGACGSSAAPPKAPPEAQASPRAANDVPGERSQGSSEAPAAPEVPTRGFDAMLSSYRYPYEVHRFHFESQGKELEMAYMLLEAQGQGAETARTVTLLHGKNFSGAYFQSTADALSRAGYRVVMPDQIGFGKSSKPLDFQYSFHEMARQTSMLLNALGVAETAVVGHSMGGMLAVRFALMKPEMTTALVLVNPIGLEDWKRVVPYRSVDQWTAQNEKATPEGIRKYMKESYFGGQWKPEYDALAEIQAGWAIGPDHPLIARVSALHYDTIFTQPVVHEFVDLEVPTLLVIGQRDRTALGKDWASPEVAKTLGDYPALGRKTHEAIKGSKLVELDDVGHIPMMESPDAWLAALLGFLG